MTWQDQYQQEEERGRAVPTLHRSTYYFVMGQAANTAMPPVKVPEERAKRGWQRISRRAAS
jgi:hypothetical protein